MSDSGIFDVYFPPRWTFIGWHIFWFLWATQSLDMPATIKMAVLPALLTLAFIFLQCRAQNAKGNFRNTEAYDFANPKQINLPKELDEISGISFYPKDNSVFAIIDEDGVLFKISLNDPSQIRQWQFDKPRDYEDVVLKDSVFYVLVSNGDVEELRFSGDKIVTNKIGFPNASKKINEFESLYYDPVAGKMVMMCKSCEEDKKTQISSYYINDSTQGFSNFSVINAEPISEKLGLPKEHVKPSAAAINPATGELYILCSVNKAMVIEDAKGNLKDVIKLNPEIYKQPEGIAFTPKGDLIISNESHQEGYGTLLLLKNKKSH